MKSAPTSLFPALRAAAAAAALDMASVGASFMRLPIAHELQDEMERAPLRLQIGNIEVLP